MDPENVTLVLLISALLAVIMWNIITVLLGLPTSSSHALIGSLIGAVIAYKGFGVLKVHGIIMILVAMLISPVLGALFLGKSDQIDSETFPNHAPLPGETDF